MFSPSVSLTCSRTSVLVYFSSFQVMVRGPESSSRSWSNPVGRVCHIVCSHPRYIPNSEVQGGSGPGQRNACRAKWQACPGSVWSDSGLGRGGREPCQELSLRAPVLRPGRPGSGTVTCVGGRTCTPLPGTLAAPAAWGEGWLPSLPTHASFTGGSSLTSHGLSSSLVPVSFA